MSSVVDLSVNTDYAKLILDCLRLKAGFNIIDKSIENAKQRDRMTDTQRDTAYLWGALLIGCFRPRRFLNTLKSMPEFEKQVPNQRKEFQDSCLVTGKTESITWSKPLSLQRFPLRLGRG